MNGGFGFDVYGFVSTDATAKGWPSSRAFEVAGGLLGEHRHVVALGRAGGVEVAAAGDPLVVDRHQRRP